MQNCRNRISRGCLYGALGVSALTLLSGCNWFDSSKPADLGKLRPGLERDVAVSSSLPPPPAGQRYDPPIAPVDTMRNTPQIGSIVRESGGQKAQLEKLDKEDQTRDAQEREAQEKADAAAKEAEKNAASGKQANTTGEPPTQPAAPPRAPVRGTPVAPPSTDTAPTPAPPAGTKPAGS
jgi:hypothetical protein